MTDPAVASCPPRECTGPPPPSSSSQPERVRMAELALIALAGAAGSLARYGVGLLAARSLPPSFAWGTLVVNVVGCFLLATLLTTSLVAAHAVPRAVKLAVGTGFLGAFTTFSTFGYETLAHVEQGATRLAIWNVVANLALGLAAGTLGLLLGRAIGARL